MKKLLIAALLALPCAAYAQDLNKSDLDLPSAGKGTKGEAADSLEPVQRPDADKIMSELSTALRLSSKQEDRISSAVAKKTKEFDKLLKEYEKNAAEEKKWRYKANATRHEMVKLKRELPDTVREFLDDAQRESYDELLQSGKKAGGDAVQAEEGAAKPAKKKRLIRRKKVPAGDAVAPGEEEAGQTMVDKEVQAAPRKKKILKKKPVPAEAEEASGSKPTGKEAAPEDEDAGAYP